MKFLLDVHVGTSIAKALEANGHDVLRAMEDHANWSDAALLRLAVIEARTIITEDRDFSDLVFRHGEPAPPCILYLRCKPAEQPRMAERVLLVLANVTLQGHMVVIRPASFRLRPFPKREEDNG